MLRPEYVAIYKGNAWYSPGAPFHPAEKYPELPFEDLSSGAPNPAYEAVRNTLQLLGLDQGNFGKATWNPLGELIIPGDHVVLKPNWIRESHSSRHDEWEQVITHPSLIRAVLDYVLIALKGEGKVTIADGPQTDSDFDEIVRRTGLDSIVEYFLDKGLDVSLLDLRRERWLQREGVTQKREALPGDPAGYTTIDLGYSSEFADHSLGGRFYGADYDMADTAKYHSHGRHAYVLCRTVMDADVIINLPKMKTHKKTGVTLSLKNMVGVNGYRNCLPHHTLGTPVEGGDEFPESSVKNRIQSRVVRGFKRQLTAMGGCGGLLSRSILKAGQAAFGKTSQVVRSGNWHGNDTAWRMVLDLNKCLFHFAGDGGKRGRPLRYMTIVDGIVAGEGDGPAAPDAKACGVVVAGCNPVAVDMVCAALMGFDYRKLPVLREAWGIEAYPLMDFDISHMVCRSNVANWDGSFAKLEKAEHLGFRPHFGWLGHVERSSVQA